MKRFNGRVLSVWLQVFLSNLNPLHLLTIGLMWAAAMAWLVLVPIRQHQIQEKQGALTLLRASIQQTPPTEMSLASSSESNFRALKAVLGDAKHLEQPVKTTLDMAQRAGLQVMQAQYKYTCDSNQFTCSYKVQLPVKGTYGSIRRLLEHALAGMPNASLDEIQVKREDISSDELDVRLRFSFYVLADATALKNQTEQAP